ncbi:two-component system, OmpR family, response regulator RstA [Microbulbifer donghaiensis]|uniref:Two-component system, OmpR family, response regulator RstA n=1 Tax=Microbulbifer donghaiensis TaxID=494016 RepID=A0A1M4XMD8_9GAMM|nr:response regulator transcription factor [Microbulbifer donghaiensis]SHE94372.1 two-component system, OmpR family, response regulator RstA [Microbulbifer donghaiensis]
MPSNWILIVDDDRELAELLASFLQKNGLEAKIETDGARATDRILEEQPRLVILDVMLPGQDGLSICRQVLSGGAYRGPILMLSALEDDVDEVAGLEVGADDYLTKPVRSRVLLARIRALLRRHEAQTERPGPAQPAGDALYKSVNGLQIDRVARRVTLNGDEIELTTFEFELLWMLALRAGDVLTREEISEHFTGLGYDSTPRTIDLRISHLRKKLGDDPKLPRIIITVRGKGYQLASEQCASH